MDRSKNQNYSNIQGGSAYSRVCETLSPFFLLHSVYMQNGSKKRNTPLFNFRITVSLVYKAHFFSFHFFSVVDVFILGLKGFLILSLNFQDAAYYIHNLSTHPYETMFSLSHCIQHLDIAIKLYEYKNSKYNKLNNCTLITQYKQITN